MVTTLEIDKTLLQEALDLSNHPTPTTLIEAALREYIQRRKQLKILELFGTIDYDEDYNYKQQRPTSGKSRYCEIIKAQQSTLSLTIKIETN